MAGLLGKGANKSVRSSNHIGDISRTKCPRHFKWRTTFSAGKLIPLFMDEFLPAETKSVSLGELVRSITPLGPTMDNSFLDIFCFFVPRRLTWDHWEEFIAGYNKEAWAQDVEYEVPKIKFKIDYTPSSGEGVDPVYPDKNAYVHSFLDYLPGALDVIALADFMKLECTVHPTDDQDDVDELTKFNWIDAQYPRSYVKVWNDWFRDENLQDELELYTGDDDEYAQDFAFDLLDPDALPSAAKYHNRFTSALPSPVKGPDVLIPMKGLQVGYDASSSAVAGYSNMAHKATVAGEFAPLYQGSISGENIVANNVSNTIRMLRLATQTELLLSRDARGGTRYVESLLSHFAVHNGDARLQRSEYLGSRQIPLSITQVTNTSQADSNALGNVGGQSVTKDNAHYFTYSATEHGILVIVGCVRTNLSYSSGVRKIYQRFTRFEHIWPEFKHIGDVPLMVKELDTYYCFTGSDRVYDQGRVFGYTPYGSELREGYNFNNGLFRAKADGSLAYLTYQEEYENDFSPSLSAEWIEQSLDPIKRTLVSQEGPQFYALFDLYMEDTIPLDPTSDPGLMDHF